MSGPHHPGYATVMQKWLTLGCALWVCALSSGAKADPPTPKDQGAQSQPGRSRRVRVEIAVWGKLQEQDRLTLFSLLGQELTGRGLALARTELPPNWNGEFSLVGGSPLTLMRVAVDVRSALKWRILIVDVERNRALVREQPGPLRNAAALEAAASVVGAAGVTLSEGFEITALRPAPPRKTPKPKPAPLPPIPSLQVFGILGLGMATFDASVPLEIGPAAAVGLRFPERVALRLSASHFPARRFESRFGQFDLDRNRLSLSGARIWRIARFEGQLSLGPSAEVLQRRDTIPMSGVAAQGSSTTFRAGGEMQAQVRYLALPFLSLELAVGAAYFPKPVRFTAAVADDPVLLEPFKLVFLGGVSVEVHAP